MNRILVVDDSPTEVYVLRGMLEKNGFTVAAASNGEQGLVMAKRDRPDLILMDVVMPGINGFQATRQLANDPSTAMIPVIVVTTKDQETDKVWAMRQGAKDYIVKPVRERDLLDRIRALLT